MSDFEIGGRIGKKKPSFTKLVGNFSKNAKTAAKKMTDEMKVCCQQGWPGKDRVGFNHVIKPV